MWALQLFFPFRNVQKNEAKIEYLKMQGQVSVVYIDTNG